MIHELFMDKPLFIFINFMSVYKSLNKLLSQVIVSYMAYQNIKGQVHGVQYRAISCFVLKGLNLFSQWQCLIDNIYVLLNTKEDIYIMMTLALTSYQYFGFFWPKTLPYCQYFMPGSPLSNYGCLDLFKYDFSPWTTC